MDYPEELTKTYEIYEQIGAGGGGVVYRAMHKRLKKMVVLKRIKEGGSGLIENRTEVDILKNLRHSYLPQVLDFIECPEGVFTVMDYIPGKSMQQMLKEGHRFSEKEVLKYAGQLSEALAYLHSQNPPIVHGDIKPDNIMVTPEGNVCLIDFNISGMFEGGGVQTFGYTPGFSSPEQKAAFEAAKEMLWKQGADAVGRKECAGNGSNGKVVSARGTKDHGEAAAGSETVLMAGDGQTGGETVLMAGDGQAGGGTVLFDDAREEVTVTLLQGDVVPEGKRGAPPAKSMDMGKIECSSDIYSLGATLYTLLTGKLLQPGAAFSLNISDGFAAILSKSLAETPGRRYPDAGKLRQALLQVHKKDKNYRRLVLRQNLAFAGLLCLIAVCVLCIIFGRQKMGEERQELYEQLVGKMGDGADTNLASDAFDALYNEAVSMYPEDVRAYYAKAYYLHETKGEGEALRYMEEFLGRRFLGHDGELGNLYYLAAECYFREENYTDACQYYEQSIRLRRDNPEVYRDYAISLVSIGRVDKAEEVLGQAVEEGMQEADIYMVKGELARERGEMEEAVDCFAQVLSHTQDEYLRQRAYIMASKAFWGMGTPEALKEDIGWLESAATKLGVAYRPLVYEALVQDYLALGEQAGGDAYLGEAVRVLEMVVENHWDTYMTYSNLIVLNQRLGKLEEAIRFGEKMSEAYPDHYVTWMRMAFLEIDRQKLLAEGKRDYRVFAEYYRKAKELAKEQLKGNVTDAELLLLDNAYGQVVEGGWIGE